LFADIDDSMELIEDLDPEEARAIIDPALKIIIDATRHYHGYVQNTGDGIFTLFGASIAHEDHPLRALWVADPLTCASFIHNTSPVYPGAQEV
jgi:class 3 adenylate cyclase